jgi:hypothetical protein
MARRGAGHRLCRLRNYFSGVVVEPGVDEGVVVDGAVLEGAVLDPLPELSVEPVVPLVEPEPGLP